MCEEVRHHEMISQCLYVASGEGVTKEKGTVPERISAWCSRAFW